MMRKQSEKGNGNDGDHRAAIIRRGKKWNMENQKWEDAAFFELDVLEVDENGHPIITGKNKKGYDIFKFARIKLRIPESGLLKLANGEKKMIYAYLEPPKQW